MPNKTKRVVCCSLVLKIGYCMGLDHDFTSESSVTILSLDNISPQDITALEEIVIKNAQNLIGTINSAFKLGGFRFAFAYEHKQGHCSRRALKNRKSIERLPDEVAEELEERIRNFMISAKINLLNIAAEMESYLLSTVVEVENTLTIKCEE